MVANLAYAGLSRKKQKTRNQQNLMEGYPFPAQKLLKMNIFT